MSNVNTIQEFVQSSFSPGLQGTLAPLALGVSTTETLFSLNPNALIPTLGGGVAVLRLIDQGSVPSAFTTTPVKGIKVRALGSVTTGGTTNITLKLYQVTNAQIAAGIAVTGFTAQAVAASTARAVNSTTAPFYLEAFLQYDPVSNRITGKFEDIINGLFDAPAASTIVTGLLAENDVNFVLSATSSAGFAANVVNLQELSIEQV